MLSIKKNKKTSIVVTLAAISILTIFVLFSTVEKVQSELLKQANPNPFHIDKQKYKIGDSVLITAYRIPSDEKGYLYFTDPNGEIFHKIVYDGSKKSSMTDYFKLESIVTDDCYSCNLVGTWKMEYNVISGPYHKIQTFEVLQ